MFHLASGVCSSSRAAYSSTCTRAQVLPADVDYRVMRTFLDFYHALLQFVNFKLYHALGVRYPPLLDPRLEQAAAGLAAIMQVKGPARCGVISIQCGFWGIYWSDGAGFVLLSRDSTDFSQPWSGQI